ncbi:MAG: hypothetical protein ACXWV4_12475 [Flavitalea sp.]
MKKLSPFLLLLALASTGFSQAYCKKAVVHAYQRSSMPGNFPQRETSEDGKIQKPVRPVLSYHIYMEDPVDGWEVSKVWINGEAFQVRTERVEKTPIIIAGGQVGKYQRNDTIQTRSSRVMRIIPNGRTESASTQKIRELATKHPVVVEFKRGKRVYYSYASTFKKLQPVVLQ